jgi:iron complex transport system ATP-binding protein
MKIIEFENVTVLRQGARILDSLDLSVVAGENTAILGPNGAGKSTLIKLMTREIYPYKMEPHVFRIFGETLWDVRSLRGRLGIVSDSISQFANPDETCFEIVASSFHNSMNLYNEEADKKAAAKAMESLEFMEIGHLKDRLISEISSGEVRRTFIARALVHEPKALMLDEPTNSLDISAVLKFRKIMSKIAGRGVTIIIATHTLQDVIPEVKNVVMLKQGKVFFNGEKEKALTDKNLSGLFNVKLHVNENNGRYSLTCQD